MVGVTLFLQLAYIALGFLAATAADGDAPVSDGHSGDDIVELLQNSIHITQQVGDGAKQAQQTSEGDDNGDSSFTNSYAPIGGHSWQQLEEMVLSRVHDSEKFAGKGNFLFVKKIGSIISKLRSSILARKKSNQQLITKTINRFSRCNSKLWLSYKGSIKKIERFSALRKPHKECEEAYADIVDSEKSHMLKLENAQAALKDAKGQWAEAKQQQSPKVCTSTGIEKYEQQLTRLLHRFKKYLKKMKRLDAEKKKKRIKLAAARAMVNRRKQMQKAMARKCKTISKQMDGAKCAAVTMLKTGCTEHNTCWQTTLKRYNRFSKIVTQEEKQMKVEWRALGRIKCFLGVLAPEKNSKKKATLEDCIKTPVNADHLNIDYGKIPKRPKCPKDKKCPCNAAYLKEEYNLKKMVTKCSRCPACK